MSLCQQKKGGPLRARPSTVRLVQNHEQQRGKADSCHIHDLLPQFYEVVPECGASLCHVVSFVLHGDNRRPGGRAADPWLGQPGMGAAGANARARISEK